MTRPSFAVIAVVVMIFARIGYCAKSVDTGVQETARFALVLGVNDPESTSRQRLKYADDDALAMHQLLEEAGTQSRLLVRFDEETAKLHPGALADGDATLNALRGQIESIGELVRDAKKQGLKTEVIFFYSGHGDVHKGEGYVVLRGGRLTRTVLFKEVI